MGGSPYMAPDTQGFVTGLATDPGSGGAAAGSSGAPPPPEQLATLLQQMDWVRFSLAGNLR